MSITDAAEALKLLDSADETNDLASMEAKLRAAAVLATLELAKQQRIANLIALAQMLAHETPISETAMAVNAALFVGRPDYDGPVPGNGRKLHPDVALALGVADVDSPLPTEMT